MTAAPKPVGRHLDSADVQNRFSISRTTLYRWLADPELDFPRPTIIKKRYYFSEAAIDAWEKQRGKDQRGEGEAVQGFPVISDVIRDYPSFVKAMVDRRKGLDMTAVEVDHRAGMQENYTNKLENWHKGYGRGMGPETFPLWLGGLRVGIVLVDLPRHPYRPKKVLELDPFEAA